MTDVTLCFPADTAAVGAAVAAARAFAAANALPIETAARLAIIVEELVSNLIDHAGLAPDARIELTLSRAGDAVSIGLADPGAPFDPRTAAFTATERPPARGGGAGLALVRAWATIDGYSRADGRNLLQLTLACHREAG
ncbi:MAG: ATP-binding protein [Polymorphobacter sp.]